MKILTRYLLRAHVGPFFFAFGALTGVVLINTLARRLADLAGKGLPVRVILEFFVLALPSAVALTFPMAVLVAVLYTFSTLVHENEVTALKASGVDLRRMLAPLLLAATILTGVMVWFNDRVLPEANHRWTQLFLDISRKTPTFALEAQTLNRISPPSGQVYYLRAARLDKSTNRMWDVVLFDVGNSGRSRTVFADSAQAMFNTSRTDLILRLHDGHTREAEIYAPETFRRVYFDEQILGIAGIGNQLNRVGGGSYRGDREMTIGMLQAKIDTLSAQRAEAWRDANEAALRDLELTLAGPVSPQADSAAEALSWAGSTAVYETAGRARRTAGELDAARRRAEDAERTIRDYAVEVHKKYSIAFASLVFVIVGAPLALRFGGGGIGMVIATSMVVFSLYYVGLIGGESLAARGIVSPLWAMWVVNALMTLVGIFGLVTMGRETSTARSSAWDSVQQAVRDFLAGPLGRLRGGRG